MKTCKFLLISVMFALLAASCSGSALQPDGDEVEPDGDLDGLIWPDDDGESNGDEDIDGDFEIADKDFDPGEDESDSDGDGADGDDGEDDADGDETYSGHINAAEEIVFDRTPLNLSVTSPLQIGNIGNGTLTVSGLDFVNCSDEFGFVLQPQLPLEVAAYSTEFVVLRYTMKNAGVDECDLKITSDDPDVHEFMVHLRTVYDGQPDIEISLSSIDFNNIEMNVSTAAQRSFTITHVEGGGDTNAVLEVGPFAMDDEGTADFGFGDSFQPDRVYMLTAGETLEVPLTFMPMQLGDRANTLVFSSNVESKRRRADHSIALSGRGVAAEVTLFPSSVNFGDKPVGSETLIPVSVTNNGESEAVISSIRLENAPASTFGLLTTGVIGTPILPGGHAYFYVSYTPAEASNHSALVVVSGNFYPDSEITINVSGHAVWPNWIIDPYYINFGEVTVGDDIEQPVTIYNISSKSIIVQSIGPTRGDIYVDSGDLALLPVTIQPSNNFVVGIHYKPSNEGPDLANLRIQTNDDVLPALDLSVSGMGIAPDMTLELASGAPFNGLMYFGEVRVGQAPEMDLLIGNKGHAALKVKNIHLDPESDDVFELVTDELAPIDPQDMGTLTVRYRPRTPIGINSGLLLAETNDPDYPQLAIDLGGLSINPQISLTPASSASQPFDVGSFNLFQMYGPWNFTLRNVGQGPLRISSVLITAYTGYGEEFSFVPPQGGNLPTELNDGQSYVFGLTFTPLLVGPVTATFTVYSNDLDNPTVNLYVRGAGSDCEPGTHDLNGDGVCEYQCNENNGGVEACNFIDDNCNGQTDENFTDVGKVCAGKGVCTAGVYECSQSGLMLCSTMPGGSSDMSGPEVCDSADNDCDGLVDEFIQGGHSAGESCSGVGECINGVLECNGPAALRCSTNPGGSAYNGQIEKCDGRDNDCDGSTDEDFSVGTACTLFGCCAGASCGNCVSGTMQCKSLTESECRLPSGGNPDAGLCVETCDGTDDDCDGQTDEEWAIGQNCNAPGVCGAGKIECGGPTTARCSSGPGGSAYAGSAEICDALDNNCNNQTDEIFPLNQTCWGQGACGQGVMECSTSNPLEVVCSTEPEGSQHQDTPEVCDAQDNDCDGVTDEGWTRYASGSVISCDGLGPCGAGVLECASLSTTRCSTSFGGSHWQGEPEKCDDTDNDCDGANNENWSTLGNSCIGSAVCPNGVIECLADGSGSVCSKDPGGSQYGSDPVELCNGIDDTCNGQTDEGYGVGAGCVGAGACGLVSGHLECNPEDPNGVICDTDIGGSHYAGVAELCDGIDNDCDGITDEGFIRSEGGQLLTCTGVGVCPSGVMQCSGPSAAVCSTLPGGSAYAGSAETCDYLDNNCNGATDEGFGVGQPCNGVGACGEGVKECHNGFAICSTDPAGSHHEDTPEICDLLDNDCDGLTNEGFTVNQSGQPISCAGVGECPSGVLECNGTAATKCSSNPGGSAYVEVPEICDSRDNDCDGITDDGWTRNSSGVALTCDGAGECGNGVRECMGTTETRCSTELGGTQYQGTAETCDSKDNDCDGATDNGFNIGQACDGVGECGTGVRQCAKNGSGVAVCSTDPQGNSYGGVPEICDSKDNDCDGFTDDGLITEADSSTPIVCDGAGVCGIGVKQCYQGGVICSTEFGGSQFGGAPETCDGLDNDCDGVSDDGFTRNADGSAKTCTGIGICGAGVLECATLNTTRCDTMPGGAHDQSQPESCDRIDNDCDGVTDDGFTRNADGSAKTCAGVGECPAGVLECNGPAATVCSTLPGGSGYDLEDPLLPGAPEICDGRDNNCDAETDEGFNVGQACLGVGECGAGVTECTVSGGQVCSTDIGGSHYAGKAELCNGMDDDCDGIYDEGWIRDDAGNPISCPGVGVCLGKTGVLECAGVSATRCSVNYGGSNWQGSNELCDSKDNDCDAATDENFNLGNYCDGVGDCGPGVLECQPLLLIAVCSTDPLGSRYDGTNESCDGRDNDCDGETDNGFPVNVACTGYGACASFIGATYECSSMGFSCSSNPGGSDYDINDPAKAGSPETCDSVDNDCDNLTDEDWEIDPYCTGQGASVNCTGRGACASAYGCFECAGPASRRCSVDFGGSQYAGSAELCDGIDNDCDGLTDEAFTTLGQPCSNPSHPCPNGFYECKADHTTVICSKDQGGSQYDIGNVQELCNGVDDDCDGMTDEGFRVSEASGLVITCDGVGECGAGVLECDGLYNTACSSNPGQSSDDSQPEICDAKDNNCDGATDEDYPDLHNPCDGIGECGFGAYECKADHSGVMCSTNPGGSDYVSVGEICDNKDNDCDGATDEGFPLGDTCDGMGVCGMGALECNNIGGVRCSTELSGGQGSQYQGSAEQCDRLDNNCDGQTDEGFQIGTVCSGSGACGQGVWECKADHSGRICSTDPGGSQNPGAQEICDLIDNNCNGETDEGFPTQQPCTGEGMCAAGLYQCKADGSGVFCSSMPGGFDDQSGPETCDSRDNDCDGTVDEGFDVGPIFPCTGKGECGAGYRECYNLVTVGCSTDIGGSQYGGTVELCDAKDNDCDGQTDEDFHIGQICTGSGQCGVGVYECNGLNAYRCSADPDGSNPGSRPEICDGYDNDCDTLTDELWPAIGSNCPAVGLCSAGKWECDAADPNRQTLRCSTSYGGSQWTGSDEICDGKDNDCDGLTDEPFQIGAACAAPGECPAGVWECKPGNVNARVCSTAPGGSEYAPMDETCDGLDNDCDDMVDEGLLISEVTGAPISCDGVGECGQGFKECDAWGGTVCSTDPVGSHYGGIPEICDFLDNDCDGITDDGFTRTQAGAPITCTGTGACGAGFKECNGPSATICSTNPGGSQYNPQPEICDQIDNNCNGQTDEGYMTGSACDGIGECGAGVFECYGTNSSICSTDVGASHDGSSAERCDSLDNDCDGSTDEGLGLGGVCPGKGICEPGHWECASNGSTRCSTGAGGSEDMSQLETCNGLDDDCDGLTDEDFDVGMLCDGVGQCGIGTWECKDGGGRRCSTDIGGSQDQSSFEICDYRDNDCDGQTDEDFNAGETCDPPGECSYGIYECASNTQTICSTGPGGSSSQVTVERCDLKDNDCDGVTDEGFTHDENGALLMCNGVGECAQGHYECGSTQWSVVCSTNSGGSNYHPQPEICDGKDNDCNGTIDDGFGIGQTCQGVGACSDGKYECATTNSTRCSTHIGGSQYPGTVEICDSQDNDCDGVTDEGYTRTVGGATISCDGVGMCGTGVMMCRPGNPYAADCSTNPGMPYDQATVEQCDMEDDDCDGLTDEDFGVGITCFGLGACGQGVVECSGISNTRCSTEPGGSQSMASSELCNLIDDDCDGKTDEGWTINAGNGQPIYCNGTGGCGTVLGVLVCDGTNATKCSADGSGSGTPEVCDGVDNNCNGQTDEGFSYNDGSGSRALGQTCQGYGGCGIGTVECRADGSAAQCSSNIGGSTYTGTSEKCNGIDDDCDGLTDEGFNVGQACTGVGDCGLYPGVRECSGLFSVICSTNPGGSQFDLNDPMKAGSPETCDSRDNDCDGATDEGFFVGQICDGAGECGLGHLECNDNGSGSRCSTNPGGSGYDINDPAKDGWPEICDGRDNDCNGTADDGFNVGQSCAGVGECGAGVYECQTTASVICSTHPGGSQYSGTSEYCDGKDNNCNGKVDETFNIYSNPANPNPAYPGNRNTCNPGNGCAQGVMECYGMQAAVCSTSLNGSQYVNNGEVCDYADNNCNGQTDENFNVGAPCMGMGECGAGVRECKADHSGTICSTVAGGSEYLPRAELCDGKDNDCDGQTDEDFQIGVMCNAQGICGGGLYECAANKLGVVCDSGPGGSHYGGVFEMCNQADDDCDGLTDEIYNVGQTCSGVGACPDGVFECYGTYSTLCSTSYGGSQFAGSGEKCDGIDNDCDGYTDELWPLLNGTCTVGGDCGYGVWVCKDDGNGLRCTADNNSQPEVCDGYDNDCDGATDENIVGNRSAGDICNGVGECGWGSYECNGPFNLRCSTDIGGSHYSVTDPQLDGWPEVCDYRDNDCDAATDEDFDLQSDASNCGTCGRVCSFPNASASCASGVCQLGSCTGDYSNIDGLPDNGCECSPQLVGGKTCATAYNLSSSLTDEGEGTEVRIQSNLPSQSTVLWYRFFAHDYPDTLCDSFHVFARFTRNPGNRFALEVYKSAGACASNQKICPTQPPVNQEDHAVEYRDQSDYYSATTGRGECPCVAANPSEGYHLCQDNSQLYYIKVYAIPGMSLTCEKFELTVSNGNVSGNGPFNTN